MPLKSFKELYSMFLKDNNEKRVRWTPDHYKANFDDMNIKIERRQITLNGPCARMTRIIREEPISNQIFFCLSPWAPSKISTAYHGTAVL